MVLVVDHFGGFGVGVPVCAHHSDKLFYWHIGIQNTEADPTATRIGTVALKLRRVVCNRLVSAL